MGDISAGRAAMWIIAGAITTALVAVLVVDGFSGVPWGWWGLIIGWSGRDRVRPRLLRIAQQLHRVHDR